MDYVLGIGLAGMTLILIGFVLNVTKHLKSDDLAYLLMNFFGSGLLIWYAVLTDSLPFLILNIVWIVYAAWGLWKRAR